jgi:cysteine-rich repeat protein
MVRRWLLLGASVVALSDTPDVPEAKLLACPPGRFQMRDVEGGPVFGPGVLVLSDDGTVEIEYVCDATAADRKYPMWHGRFTARWDACRVLGRRVRLRARLADDCLGVRGIVGTSGGRRTAVTGERLAVCGDLLVSPGEDCDDGNAVAGDCCVACAAEPGCWIPCERTSDCAPQAVCERYDDTCKATTGICRPRYEGECPAGGAFDVCGCDGNAYPTECDAWAVGVSIQGGDGLNWPVGKKCRCRPEMGITCGGGLFCDMPYRCTGAVRRSLGGICVEPLASCDGEQSAPVCGCDGTTFRNDCERRVARVQLACMCTDRTVPTGERCGIGDAPAYGCRCSAL